MADKDIFEQLHPDFVNSFGKFSHNNGINLDIPVSDEEYVRQKELLRGFVSISISRVGAAYSELQKEYKEEFPSAGFNLIWGECLCLSKVFIGMLENLAAQTIHIKFDEDSNENVKKLVLAKLLGRGIRTYKEIVLLLENGFPYGAMVLTRNLLELTVIMRFIDQNDEKVAAAYYETSKKPVEYNDKYKWARASGKFSKDNDDKGVPFSRIIELSGLGNEKFKELYSVYSNFVHSSSQIVNNEVGVTADNVYAGPNIHGIEASGMDASLFIGEMLRCYTHDLQSPEVRLKRMYCDGWGELLRVIFTLSAKKLRNYADMIDENFLD